VVKNKLLHVYKGEFLEFFELDFYSPDDRPKWLSWKYTA